MIKNILFVKTNKESLKLIILFIGTFSISIDYIFNLMGYKGIIPSINWVIFPLLIVADFCIMPRRYLNRKAIKWILFLAFPLMLFFVYTDDSLLPDYLTRFKLIRAGLSAIIIFIFYYINSQSSKFRKVIIYSIFIGSLCSVLFQFLALYQFIPGKTFFGLIKGLNIEIGRVSILGDPNQANIYALGIGAFVPFIYYYSHRIRKSAFLIYLIAFVLIGFVASTGSRAASISVFFLLLVSLYVIWQITGKGSKIKLILLFFILIFITYLFWDSSIIKFIYRGIFARWQYAFREADSSVYHREQIYYWLFKEMFSKIHLIGMGYYKFYQEIGSSLPGGRYAIRWAHSSFVDSFIIGGWLLFFLYSYIWLISAKRLWRGYKQANDRVKGEAVFFLVLLIGFLVMALTLSILWLKIIWVVLGVSFGFKFTTDITENDVKKKIVHIVS